MTRERSTSRDTATRDSRMASRFSLRKVIVVTIKRKLSSVTSRKRARSVSIESNASSVLPPPPPRRIRIPKIGRRKVVPESYDPFSDFRFRHLPPPPPPIEELSGYTSSSSITTNSDVNEVDEIPVEVEFSPTAAQPNNNHNQSLSPIETEIESMVPFVAADVESPKVKKAHSRNELTERAQVAEDKETDDDLSITIHHFIKPQVTEAAAAATSGEMPMNSSPRNSRNYYSSTPLIERIHSSNRRLN